MDAVKAKRLAGQIRDKYWRDFTIDKLAQHVAIADMNKGIPLLNAIPDKDNRDREVTEASYEIMEDDPERAARFVMRVKGIDGESQVRNIISNLVARQPGAAKSLLRHLHSTEWRDLATQDIVEAIASRDPKEAEKLAQTIKGGEAHAAAMAAVAAAYTKTDLPRAMRLAGEAVSLAHQVANADDKRRLAVQIAPMLASVDPQQAVAVLEPVTPTVAASTKRVGLYAFYVLELAGAWAFVDRRKAQVLFQKALELDKRVCIGPHGNFLVGGFTAFIKGLARQQPEHAAAWFQEQGKAVRYADTIVSKILLEVADIDLDNALFFAKAIGGQAKQTELQQQVLAKRAATNPAQAEPLLIQIVSPEDRDEAACDVAVKWAATDLTAAKRVTATIQKPSKKADALRRIAKYLLRKHDPEALNFLRDAVAVAQNQKGAFSAASNLVRISDVALTAAVPR